MNEFLTQSQLAERLVQKTGIQLEIAKKFSTVFFTIVKKGLKDRESFYIYNFGTFKKTWIEATTGLNPSSGEKIDIPAHWRIKFVPCAAVAKRLNRPYAHLKAKEVPEDTVLPEEDPTSSIPAALVQPEDDGDDNDDDLAVNEEDLKDDSDEEENDSSEEKAVTKHNVKILAIAGAVLLLLILLVSLIFKGCSSKKTENQKKAKVQKEKEPVYEESETEIESSVSEEAEIDIASLMFGEFAVPDGSDYHTIAEEKYGNRHMWPIIFAANKNLSCDPDFVAKYRTIKVPAMPEGSARDKVISSAVLEAYNAYLLMCEKEPDSPKNEERHRLATRVLVSGELLVPGFIAEFSSRILPEYAESAMNIVVHQYQ